MRNKLHKGFTLIELMIVISIIAVLLMVAVPSFALLIKKNNIESLQANVSSAIATARSEAASRNVVVSICIADTAGTACDVDGAVGTLWLGAAVGGWIVFEDRNGDAVIDAGDEVIDVFNNTGSYSLRANNSVTNAAIYNLSFSSQGFLSNGGTDTIFTICEPDNDVSYARGLYVARSGLVMKTEDTNDTGTTHNVPGGIDLVCI